MVCFVSRVSCACARVLFYATCALLMMACHEIVILLVLLCSPQVVLCMLPPGILSACVCSEQAILFPWHMTKEGRVGAPNMHFRYFGTQSSARTSEDSSRLLTSKRHTIRVTNLSSPSSKLRKASTYPGSPALQKINICAAPQLPQPNARHPSNMFLAKGRHSMRDPCRTFVEGIVRSRASTRLINTGFVVVVDVQFVLQVVMCVHVPCHFFRNASCAGSFAYVLLCAALCACSSACKVCCM